MNKIENFLQSEKLKNFTKKLFSKKTIVGVLTVGILAAVLNIGFHTLFEINGVVKGINGTQVTVSDFFSTRTVDVGSGVDISGIKVGERVRISKNINGEVLNVNAGHDGHSGYINGRSTADRGYGDGSMKGNGGQMHGRGGK